MSPEPVTPYLWKHKYSMKNWTWELDSPGFKSCLTTFWCVILMLTSLNLSFLFHRVRRMPLASIWVPFSSVQFSRSVVSDSLQPHGLQPPAHHQLPELAQIHVHWVSDAIQPSLPLLSSSPPAVSLSQHQGLFQWVSSLHPVAKVLEFQLQHQSFPMNIQDWFPLKLTGLTSSESKGISRVFSNTTIQKHQFFSTQLSL